MARHGNSLTGIDMRLADDSDLAGVELLYPDGPAWAGEGAFDYVREARIIGRMAGSENACGRMFPFEGQDPARCSTASGPRR